MVIGPIVLAVLIVMNIIRGAGWMSIED